MRKLSGKLFRDNLWGYILSFSAIILFIVLFMGIYLYWYYYRTIYHDFENANEEYLESVARQHENNILILEDITAQLSLEGGNVEFILRDQPEKSFLLKDMLYQYSSTSRFFSHIFFFYHADSYLYNHRSSVSVDNFLANGLLLENCGKEELKNFIYREEAGMAVLPEQKAEGYLTERMGAVIDRAVIYFLPVEPGRRSTVLFLVDSGYYDALLESEASEARLTGILYGEERVTERGWQEQQSNGAWPDAASYLAGGERSGQKKVRENGRTWLLTWMTGESGLTYYTMQSGQIFRNKIFMGQWGILLVLGICSIPTSLAFGFLARRLSGRVRSISALLGEEESWDLTCLEDGVRVLVEKRSEGREESLLLRRTEFISDFVRGQFSDREAMLQAAEQAKLNVNRAYYAVALMGDRDNDREDEVHEMMLHAIADRRSVDGYGLHLINSGQSLYLVFGNSAQELEAAMEDLFIIGKNGCEEFVMSVSDFHQDFSKAADAYLEADSAYGTRLLVDNGSVIYFRDVKLGNQTTSLSDAYLQRLKNAIRIRQKLEVQMVIQEICQTLKTSGQSLFTFRMLCNNIIHILLAEGGADSPDFESVYNVFALSQCLTINDFHDILWEVCSRLMDRSRGKEEAKPDFVTDAVEYMKENYADPELNMTALAEHLGVSGVTLTVKFKNVMEISPSDYLASLRLERAKNLLRQTELQVKEISSLSGYEDVRVFLRRFKKYTGMTPSQYREQQDNV